MDSANLFIEGHVLIKDCDSGEIILNRRNAIHPENMSFAIASVMSNYLDINGSNGFIDKIAFGNGGVVVNDNGQITYNSVNIDKATDTLYNQTYLKKVNFSPDKNPDTNITVVHENGTTYSDIVVKCTLDYNEPVDQSPYDNTISQEGKYVFDEIGLMSHQGRLLTHLIFHPVKKSENRKIQIIYTIRISVG